MWTLDYAQEVKNYFLDNYPYTFPLLIEIERLKFAPAGIPENCSALGDELYWWEILDHAVVYERRQAENVLFISTVKPL